MKPAPLFSCGPAATLLLVIIASASAASKVAPKHPEAGPDKAKVYEDEYNDLHANTEDKDGLESIRYKFVTLQS